jgi:hypothetical protein
MATYTFHYPGCRLMTDARRAGWCNCKELFDLEHAEMRRRMPWLFRLLKRITFKEIHFN